MATTIERPHTVAPLNPSKNSEVGFNFALIATVRKIVILMQSMMENLVHRQHEGYSILKQISSSTSHWTYGKAFAIGVGGVASSFGSQVGGSTGIALGVADRILNPQTNSILDIPLNENDQRKNRIERENADKGDSKRKLQDTADSMQAAAKQVCRTDNESVNAAVRGG